MAILNPDHLLEQAEYLLQARDSRGLVRQANRRRAISTAYYAVFHFTLTAAADEVVGNARRNTPRYALVYRSVDHKALEVLCKVAGSAQLSERYAKYAPQNGFGANIREFASLVVQLKEKRNSADYDPTHWVKIADARKAIDTARSAVRRFKSANAPRRQAFLTLLLFPPR